MLTAQLPRDLLGCLARGKITTHYVLPVPVASADDDDTIEFAEADYRAAKPVLYRPLRLDGRDPFPVVEADQQRIGESDWRLELLVLDARESLDAFEDGFQLQDPDTVIVPAISYYAAERRVEFEFQVPTCFGGHRRCTLDQDGRLRDEHALNVRDIRTVGADSLLHLIRGWVGDPRCRSMYERQVPEALRVLRRKLRSLQRAAHPSGGK